MAMKVDFSLEGLLGDLLSGDGLFVDLLNCDEYTVWYLMRQAGLPGFIPAIGTQAFLPAGDFNKNMFKNINRANLEQVVKNLEKYYGIGLLQFKDRQNTIHEFIMDGLKKKRFIHTYYNHYYNTLAPEPREDDFHGHPVTGYDGARDVYLSIAPGFYEVRREDFHKMAKSAQSSTEALSMFFYLEGAIPAAVNGDVREIRERALVDFIRTADSWEDEIRYCNEYASRLAEACNPDDKIAHALEQRLFFNEILEGVHGNFLFKLRLLDDLFQVDTSSLRTEFLSNRKQSIVIANMFRKTSILLEAVPECHYKQILKISKKIKAIFVQESERLLFIYRKALKPIM